MDERETTKERRRQKLNKDLYVQLFCAYYLRVDTALTILLLLKRQVGFLRHFLLGCL